MDLSGRGVFSLKRSVCVKLRWLQTRVVKSAFSRAILAQTKGGLISDFFGQISFKKKRWQITTLRTIPGTIHIKVPSMSFYPDFLETHFIQILSRFNPDFMNFFVKILQIGPLVSKSG